MSAPTVGRVNGSAYPFPPATLLPKARALVSETGALPSENALMREFSISRTKAKAVRAELATDAPADPVTAAPEPVAERAPVAPAPPVPVPASEPVAVAECAPERTPSTAGRWHAWGGFLFGTVASLAANVAHAQQHIGAQLVAAFAPLALLVVVEVSARVEWAPSVRFVLARWVGVGAVALIAFTVSYRAQAALFLSYGLDPLSAAILPLAVDGLMLVCGAALLSIGGRRTQAVT